MATVISGPASSSPFSAFIRSKQKKRINPFPPINEFALDMNEPSLESLNEGTFEDRCLSFGYILGIDQPVSEKVLIAALNYPYYAKELLTNRDSLRLQVLLNNPPESSPGDLSAASNGSLLVKAGKAIFNWGLSGFPTVSKETLKKREDACLACPNLIESQRALQRISASSRVSNKIGERTGNKSCGICGCVVKNKMRLATETCPQEISDGLNRWSEPIINS